MLTIAYYCLLSLTITITRILYGAHETGQTAAVVHPSAAMIWADGASGADVWKTSKIRADFEDNQWHHWAAIVSRGTVKFALDGDLYPNSTALPRPITDCPDGVMTLGSSAAAGELVNVMYIPRELFPVELRFLFSKGKLLDDMLAGAGAQAAAEDPMDAVIRTVKDTGSQNLLDERTTASQTMFAFRKLQQVQAEEALAWGLASSRRLAAEAQGRPATAGERLDGAAAGGAGAPGGLERAGRASESLSSRDLQSRWGRPSRPPGAEVPVAAAAPRRLSDACEDTALCDAAQVKALLMGYEATVLSTMDDQLRRCMLDKLTGTGYLTVEDLLNSTSVADDVVLPPGGVCNAEYAGQESKTAQLTIK